MHRFQRLKHLLSTWYPPYILLTKIPNRDINLFLQAYRLYIARLCIEINLG